MLSPTALLYPGATQDDGKRANFVNVQFPQYIPAVKKSLARYRTGFDEVIAHRVGLPFSYVARDNGQVVEIDEDSKLLKIQYTGDKTIHVIQYGELYTKNSSESF